jgi:hypothetical protein
VALDRAAFERAIRQAEAHERRRIEAYNRQVDQHNQRERERVRENERRIAEHNRKVEAHNQRVLSEYNRQIQQVNAHNQAAFSEMNQRLRVAESGPRYTIAERALADRIQQAIVQIDGREWDVFLSYARIDGAEVGELLYTELKTLGMRVWFDEVTIAAGKSQSRQMDQGLSKARAGVVLLTPAYVAGRFWTERELGALLHKDTLIPVLHEVTFGEVAEYSGILPDLAGFETSRDSVGTIAQKIASAVMVAQ